MLRSRALVRMAVAPTDAASVCSSAAGKAHWWPDTQAFCFGAITGLLLYGRLLELLGEMS